MCLCVPLLGRPLLHLSLSSCLPLLLVCSIFYTSCMFSQRGERSMLRVTRAETARRPPTSPNAAHDLISRSKVIRPLIDSLVCPSAASGSTDSFLHVRFKDIKLIPEASKTPQIQTSSLHPKRRTRLRVIIDLSSRDDSDSVNEQLRVSLRSPGGAVA